MTDPYADDPTPDIRTYRWTAFIVVRDRGTANHKIYDVFTYHQIGPDLKRVGDMYFHAYPIAYMLGHEQPDVYIKSLPEHYRKTVPDMIGVFLNEQGVRDLAAIHNDEFVLNWIDEYMNRCNAVDPAAQTGFTPASTKDVECPF